MHLVEQFKDTLTLLYMRTRINEIYKQIVINENETLSYRVNSPPFRCKAETQVYHQSPSHRTGLNYFTKVHAPFLGKVRGIKKGIHMPVCQVRSCLN